MFVVRDVHVADSSADDNNLWSLGQVDGDGNVELVVSGRFYNVTLLRYDTGVLSAPSFEAHIQQHSDHPGPPRYKFLHPDPVPVVSFGVSDQASASIPVPV